MDRPIYNKESLAQMLREHGIMPTHQRMEIAYVLFGRQEHLSADRVMALVNERHPETSRATVYNTLRLFVERKMAREVIVNPSRVFYDPNAGAHYHMYEVESGQLTDIDAASVTITGLPVLPDDMVTEGMDVIIRVRRTKPGENSA
jgi:Fur family transcriptional regulator, iron response regulator